MPRWSEADDAAVRAVGASRKPGAGAKWPSVDCPDRGTISGDDAKKRWFRLGKHSSASTQAPVQAAPAGIQAVGADDGETAATTTPTSDGPCATHDENDEPPPAGAGIQAIGADDGETAATTTPTSDGPCATHDENDEPPPVHTCQLWRWSDDSLRQYLHQASKPFCAKDFEVWLALRKRQWRDRRCVLRLRRKKRRETEERERLQKYAQEWNAALRAVCTPWSPSEVFRSEDFATRVNSRISELIKFDEEDKAGEPPGYGELMRIYPRAPAEVRRFQNERERKGTDGAWSPRKRLAKARAAPSFEEAAMFEVRDGFLLGNPDDFKDDFAKLVERYATINPVLRDIERAYYEENKKWQMECDCFFCRNWDRPSFNFNCIARQMRDSCS
jgi:hypothetical protein